MSNEEIEAIFQKLTYTMQIKTDKIMELRSNLNDMPKKFALPITLSAFSGLYTTISFKRYLNYALSTFGPSNNVFSSMNPTDLGALIILATGVIGLYLTDVKHKKTKESYETLRKDIIKSINNGFCCCNQPCGCKDDYIKAMESLRIDLVL